jgi:predicted small integral membrane protein
MNIDWMAWTPVTASFFGFIVLMLAGMTVWQIVSPSIARRGFLPIVTTRGDRLFISLLGSAYIHLAWLGLTDLAVWIATVISVAFLVTVMRWG